jgi:magnesium-transporting ATPase (P-type)
MNGRSGSAGTPAGSRATVLENSEAWHTLPADEVARRIHTELGRGLSGAEAAHRLERHGPNALAEKAARSPLAIVVDQFKSLIVALLLAATAVAVALGENLDAVAILVVISFTVSTP